MTGPQMTASVAQQGAWHFQDIHRARVYLITATPSTGICRSREYGLFGLRTQRRQAESSATSANYLCLDPSFPLAFSLILALFSDSVSLTCGDDAFQNVPPTSSSTEPFGFHQHDLRIHQVMIREEGGLPQFLVDECRSFPKEIPTPVAVNLGPHYLV